MFEKLTIEETEFLKIFDMGSREKNIAEIKAAMPYFDDGEMASLAERTIATLEKMNDGEFTELAELIKDDRQ